MAPSSAAAPTCSMIQLVETDLGRVMGSNMARLFTSWEQMPMARLTLKRTV